MRLPDDSKRHTIIGRTGSGKTHFALHALSHRSIDTKPWVVLNFKEDELINAIPGAVHLPGTELAPDARPGVYVMHPAPDDFPAMESLFENLWTRRDTGLFVDEAYMLDKSSPWFRRLLTQGRSRNAPLILCTQRAAWLDRFVFSESDFFSVFKLSDKRDVKTVHNFVDETMDVKALPEYASYYFDVGKSELHVVAPVAGAPVILEQFRRKIPQPLSINDDSIKPTSFFI